MEKSDIDVPAEKELFVPILRVLSKGDIMQVDILVDGVIELMNLPSSVLEIKATNKAKSMLKERVEWACSNLKSRGLIEYPKTSSRNTANRRITHLGLQVLEENRDPKVMPVLEQEVSDDGWYPTDYSPEIAEQDWIDLISDPEVFNRRSLDLMSKMLSFDGVATCKQISQRFGGTPQAYNSAAIQLARRVHLKTGCPLDVRDSGESRFWPVLFLGKNAGSETEGTFIWMLRPELRAALAASGVGIAEESDSSDSDQSFFDYLADRGLEYTVESVEDFLLSLKAKQFVIFSGGTGTGKTKLAQAYGDFISGSRKELLMKTQVTLGKSMENNGFTLNRDDFFKVFPDEAKADGSYDFIIGDHEGRGEIKMTPRFWFARDENRPELIDYLRELKEKGDKAEFILKVPGSSEGGTNYAIVPVGSNWTDNRHILGYRNAISGQYTRTAALDLMLASCSDAARPYMLILDEMNLSHVERYFSDVISCMESGEPIPLDSDGTVPERLVLGSNLFIIGTVNMDETTYMFSPKVLDRANVLEFDLASVDDYFSRHGPSYVPSGDVAYLQDCCAGLECRDMSAREIMDEIQETVGQQVTKPMIEDISSMQKHMSDMKLPFAYRTLDEIMRFMYVAWVYEGRGAFGNWRRYLDSQIRQKILPKIHGNTTILGGLEKMKDLCEQNGYSRSAEKLKRMVEVLETQRYVSFNC